MIDYELTDEEVAIVQRTLTDAVNKATHRDCDLIHTINNLREYMGTTGTPDYAEVVPLALDIMAARKDFLDSIEQKAFIGGAVRRRYRMTCKYCHSPYCANSTPDLDLSKYVK